MGRECPDPEPQRQMNFVQLDVCPVSSIVSSCVQLTQGIAGKYTFFKENQSVYVSWTKSYVEAPNPKLSTPIVNVFDDRICKR